MRDETITTSTSNNRIRWEDAFSVIDPQINAEGEHIFPFDPACPVDVRFFRFGRRRFLRMNHHAYFELLYVASGAITCYVQDRRFEMRKGDMAVISSALYHTHQPHLARHSQVNCIALYFLPEVIGQTSAKGDEVQYLSSFLLQNAAFPHVIPAQSEGAEQIVELLKIIRRELPATTNLARLSIKTHLKMILLLLAKHYAAYTGGDETLDRKQQSIERLRPLFDRLETCYGDQLSVADAATLVGMSESHFMRFFKSVTGQPLVTYINHFRIAKAQEMLANTNRSISEIAQQVGFCDQSYFSLTFRKLVHMTPLQYKRQLTGSPARISPIL